MKAFFHIFILILASVAFQTCSSTGSSRWVTFASDGTMISARGAVGRMEAAPSGPLYTGDGGGNIRLAVLAPQVEGEVPQYLPIYIQGLLNNNFSRYSAINLIDRQNLDNIIAEQNLAANGRYSDNDFVRIGNLTNAQYFLFGTIQKLSGDRYSLQLSVTDSSTGIRRANFMKDGTLAQLEGRGTLINEATAELLAQLGVVLTETGLQTLLAGNTSTARAEAGLARGITAQAGGSEIEALFNYTQAITFDPSRIETLSRLNILSTTISGGTISQRIVNDIQARDSWLEAFKETARFFNDHPPFEIIFDPNLIQIGQTNYARRTANIGMRIALDPSQAGFDALNALLEGLEKTGRRREWGFSGWPLMDITPRTTGTVVFGGRRSFSFKVDVALVNENNKTISRSSVTLNTEAIRFSAGNTIVMPPDNVVDVVSFQNVKTEDLTPILTIVITAVNGISSRNLNASGYMKIETGDFEQKGKEFFEQGISNYEIGDLDRAIADYTQAIRLDPNLAVAYILRGNAYSEKGNIDQDIADCTQAIRIDPNLTVAYYSRGNGYLLKRDYNRAIADYTQAIHLDPNFANVYSTRGYAYYNKGDYDRAIADFTQAILLNPNDAVVYNNHGHTYYGNVDYNRAFAAGWLNPNNNIAYYYRGLAYFRHGVVNDNKGDYDRAIADYTQALRLDPNDANAYYWRGYVYSNKGDYDLAIADYTQSLRLDPNDASVYYWRGSAYRNKEDYDQAIADYTQAIRIDPNYASAYYWRGSAYYSKRDYDRAIADYTQTLRLNPNDASAYNRRGNAYYSKRDYDRAIADYEAALRLDPNNATLRQNLENARQARGR
jgi:tetratricopeptide (TPR) repeat protein